MRFRRMLAVLAMTLAMFGGTVAAAGPATAAQGTVKWFNAEKGYGFASPDA